MTSRIFGALLMILFLASEGSASDVLSQHGGRAVDAGEYHVEIVAKADIVDVYLADHDNKAIRSAGFKGLAILIIDGKSQRIVLAPAGEFRLSGKATGELPSAPKGVVQNAPLSDRFHERLVITLGLIGIVDCKVAYRVVKNVARSHVARDHGGVARACMCAGQRPPARFRISSQ